MSGHVKQFEGIKWYSKGKFAKDLDWEDIDEDELVLISTSDIHRGLDVYTKNGDLFGTIDVIDYAHGKPYQITILQPTKMRFICPITKFFTYKFQKKEK